MFFSIDTIIADHFKMFIRDMNDELFNKINSRNSFSNQFVVLVAVVMKGYILTIVVVNARSGDNGSA